MIEAVEEVAVMDFNEYQMLAEQTAIYDNDFYPIASLMVEAAELADLFVKPVLRGDAVDVDRTKLVSEAGDVLWNLAVLLKRNNIKLEDVAVFNIEKLKSRMARGVIQGSGGDR
jgi:NTP pyrophosphatase (non-canonical NTP hydrolase)